MYEYHNYKLKIGKYGKYIALLDKKEKIIVNIGLEKNIQEKINIYNLNQKVLDKILIIHSNKIMNKNLNNSIVKMLSETETEPEPEKIEIIEVKFVNDHI